VDQQLKAGMHKIGEVVHEFITKISDLEACVVPPTPPEERKRRKHSLKNAISHMQDIEGECQQTYEVA